MASIPYSIDVNNSVTIIPEESLDTTTSLELPGRYYSEWGEKYAQNYAKLLENFRTDGGTSGPSNAVPGQLWFDGATGLLKLRHLDNQWGEVAPSPVLTATGDVLGTGPLSGPVTLTLADVQGLVPGFYSTPAITVDSKGRVVGVDNTGGDGDGPAQYVASFNDRGGAVVLNFTDVT